MSVSALTISEASEILNVPLDIVLDLVEKSDLPAMRAPDGRRLILRSDLLGFIKRSKKLRTKREPLPVRVSEYEKRNCGGQR
jgi:excisionase family DNA binding protein